MMRRFFPSTIRQGVSEDLLLNLYPSDSFCWSVRKLDKDYSGASLRVFHYGDTTVQQDIGFVDGLLDVASLEAFSATSSTGLGCGVVDLYSQGNTDFKAVYPLTSWAPRATSAANAVFTIGGIPYIDFFNTSIAVITESNVVSEFSLNSAFLVYQYKSISQSINYALWDTVSSGGLFLGGTATGINGFGIASSNAVKAQSTVEDLNLHLGMYIGNTEKKIWVDSGAFIQAVDTSFTDPNINRIGRATNLAQNAYQSEIITYETDQSVNRIAIRDNINNYYGIF